MKKAGLLAPLVGATLVVATLATLIAKGGWMIWIPVVLALATVACIGTPRSRR